MIMSIITVIMVIQINKSHGRTLPETPMIVDGGINDDLLENPWDFVQNFPGTENCPRCNSVPECYAECNKKSMKRFNDIASWSKCKDKCLSLGGDFAFEYDTWDSDRGCAMYVEEEQGLCICVEGTQMACKNIGQGMENCPNCGNPLTLGIIGGAPECLATCDWDHAQEFHDIAGWDDCENKCLSLGGDYTYEFGIVNNLVLDPLDQNSDRGCAVYSPYDNKGNQGLCVCFEGGHHACDGVIWENNNNGGNNNGGNGGKRGNGGKNNGGKNNGGNNNGGKNDGGNNNGNSNILDDGLLENVWDFIGNFPGIENCPRCNSVPECYAECNKKSMKRFNDISSWSNCKDKCISLGGDFVFEWDILDSDRGCAMYVEEEQGTCICVEGTQIACKNIGQGMENCPSCGNSLTAGIIGGAPECLATCDWKHAREFHDIASWDDCEDTCLSLGGDFTYEFGIVNNVVLDPLDPLDSVNPLDENSDRGCAVYAPYDNKGNQGLCVCFKGGHHACDGAIWGDAPSGATSFDMIEGYGIGVISTLIILLIGIFIAYICRRWSHISKRAGSVKYPKVINVDETTDDERVVIKQ